jgi:hypothetical protein
MLSRSLVTMAWQVLRLQMETASTYRIIANILNKQLQTPDKGWSYSLWVGGGAKNAP